MIPILYASNETAFTSNGLGRLRDCLTCTVTEERNGVYECDFSYPITGQNYEKIKLGRIIAVEHDDTDDVQPFDIVSCSRPIDGVVTFHAVHLSYRQRFTTVSGTNINSLSDAFTELGNAQPSNPFTYWTDKGSIGYVAAFDGVPRSVRSILGGVEGSILDAYGGEYLWDKWQVNLYGSRGSDRNLTIRYGVNMLDYSEDLNYSESYTACVPYWKGSGDVIVTGNMVSSGQNPYNGVESCVPLDLTEKFETQPTVAQLESMASSLMASKQTYLPAQSISVDFVRLQDSAEYAHLAPLLECKLCDTVKVVMPMYGTSGTFKIVKTVYNVLLEKFDSMELGTLSTSLSEALGISGGSSSGAKEPNVMVATGASGSMSLSSGTITQVTLTTASVSLGAGLAIDGGGIKVSNSGTYRVSGSVYITAASSVTQAAVYIKSGSSFGSSTELVASKDSKASGGLDCIANTSKVVSLSAGDIVYLAGRSSGATGTLYTANASTYLQVEQIA